MGWRLRQPWDRPGPPSSNAEGVGELVRCVCQRLQRSVLLWFQPQGCRQLQPWAETGERLRRYSVA